MTQEIPTTEKLVQDYASGKSIRELAEAVGFSITWVRSRLLEGGAKIRKGGPVTGQRQLRLWKYVDDITEQYTSDKSLEDIAKVYDTSPGVIRTVLARAGIPIRPPGNSRKRRTIKNIDEVIKDYKDGSSINDLVNKHGYSFSAIQRNLVRAGVEMRPAGRPPVTLNTELNLGKAIDGYLKEKGIPLRDFGDELGLTTGKLREGVEIVDKILAAIAREEGRVFVPSFDR